VVDPAAVGRVSQPSLELVHDQLERLIEVSRAGFGPHDRAARTAGDLDVLAAIFLAPVLFVLQLDVGSDDLVVVAFDSGEFVGDVLPKVLRNFDVAASDNYLDQSFASFHATSTVLAAATPIARYTADKR
jgi:hypothetical protein